MFGPWSHCSIAFTCTWQKKILSSIDIKIDTHMRQMKMALEPIREEQANIKLDAFCYIISVRKECFEHAM